MTQPKNNHRVHLPWLILASLGLGLYIVSLIPTVQSGYIETDFAMFYTGAVILRSDQRADLYDLKVQGAIQQPLTHPWVYNGGVLPFNYPPYIALLFMGFAALSLSWAYVLWNIMLCAMLAWLSMLVAKHQHDRGMTVIPYAPLAIMAFPVTITALLEGQLSIVMLLAWWWIYRSWESRQWLVVGGVLALTAYKPHLAVVLALGLVVEKRWRALGMAVLVQAAVWIIAVAFCGPEIIGGYASILGVSSSASGTLGFYPEAMSNIRGILANLGVGGAVATRVAFGTWLVALLMITWVWRQPMSLAVRFSTAVILGTLASPHLYSHDTVLLLLPFFCSGILENRRWSFAICGLMFGQAMLMLSAPTVLTSLLSISMLWGIGGIALLLMWRPRYVKEQTHHLNAPL